MPVAPAASRANEKSTRVSPPRVHRKTRHSRTRMVLTAYGALSPVNRAFLPPSPAQCASIVAGLMPASRHQDHTLSPSASHLVVCRRGHVHRIPCPTFRDDREAPLVAGRDARISSDDLPDGLSEIFLSGGLDGESEAPGVICPSGRKESQIPIRTGLHRAKISLTVAIKCNAFTVDGSIAVIRHEIAAGGGGAKYDRRDG